jgi:acetolactate decarboxylase
MNDLNINRLTLLTVLLIFSNLDRSYAQNQNPEVKIYGEMRKVAMQLDTTSKFDLEDLRNQKNIYALGLVAGMNGEIMVWDSQPLTTRVVNKTETRTSNSFDVKSTLIAVTSVAKWKTIKIPSGIDSYQKLQDYIQRAAKDAGVNVEEAFPFLITGKMKNVGYQIMTSEGTTSSSHLRQGLHSNIDDANVQVLGLFSVKHQMIFSHHVEFMHLHGKLPNNSMCFHIEKISLGDECTLSLPN